MTKQQIKSVQGAIADCNRYIAKEEPRSADLRPADVAELLAFYKSHRAKLIEMLRAA